MQSGNCKNVRYSAVTEIFHCAFVNVLRTACKHSERNRGGTAVEVIVQNIADMRAYTSEKRISVFGFKVIGYVTAVFDVFLNVVIELAVRE